MTLRFAARRRRSPGGAVLCIGQATLDHVFEVGRFDAIGHKTRARSHRVVGGGVAANAAVTVSRLGGTAAFCGCVGDDPDGVRVIDALRRERVNTRHVLRVPDVATPVSSVIVADGGARTIVNHTDPRLFDRAAPRLDIEELGAILVDGRWPDGARAGLEFARLCGLPGIVDVDRLPTGPDELDLLLLTASHLVFSSDALADLAGTPDPAAGLAFARERTDARLAVTRGGAGGAWLDDDGTAHAIRPFDVEVVDTTGAGDVFHGAMALALAEGQPERLAYAFGSAAGAMKCTRPGARDGIPSRAEVQQHIAEQPEATRPDVLAIPDVGVGLASDQPASDHLTHDRDLNDEART